MSTKRAQSTDPQATTAAEVAVKHRLIVPVQTRGNIGKSTEVIARASWMEQRSITWAGFDLDNHNRTFSDNFPEKVSLVELAPAEPWGEIIRILRQVRKTEVTTIDPRAHMNDIILRALHMVKFTETTAPEGVRLTVLLYPIDEITDMDDIANTVEILGDSADWIVVRNPARQAKSRMYDGSELESRIRELGGVTLTVPVLLNDTRNAMRGLESKHGRAIGPVEALMNRSLGFDMAHRMILETWLREVFENFDAIAEHLLPADRAEEIKAGLEAKKTTAPPTPERRKRGGSINAGNLD